MGKKNRRANARRRRQFTTLNALDGDPNIDKLVQEAKKWGSKSRKNQIRDEKMENVTKEAIEKAKLVSEVYLTGLPADVGAARVAAAIHDHLHDICPALVPERHISDIPSGVMDTQQKPSQSIVLRCELRSAKRKSSALNAFVLLRNGDIAERFIHSKSFELERHPVNVLKSRRSNIPGVGTAWSAQQDPGSERWKIGLVQVGEKLSDDLFISFWSSSPFFDLTENSHVQLSAVSCALAITLGRPQNLLKSDGTMHSFNKTSSMLRIEFPFKFLRRDTRAECSAGNRREVSVYFSVSQPPLLFRSESDESPLSHSLLRLKNRDTLWDCVTGTTGDIRWIRTVDPTHNQAFSRMRGFRISIDIRQLSPFFKCLDIFGISETAHPTLHLTRTKTEIETPNRTSTFLLATERYKIPFSIRYEVDCLLSTGGLSLSSIVRSFWRIIARELSEKDALDTLKLMQDLLINESESLGCVDPIEMLRKCMSMCNVPSKRRKDKTLRVGGVRELAQKDSKGDSEKESDSEDMDEILVDMQALTLENTYSPSRKKSSRVRSKNVVVEISRHRYPSNQHAYIRRVIQTPTRCIATRAESDLLNRVLREFEEHRDRFLRVSFCDEDGDSIAHAGSDDLLTKIRITLRDGIFVGGEHFVFLAFSNSQLRDHAAWLYCETKSEQLSKNPPTADEIRRWMGDFSSIRVPGKYAARQGQAFSSTVGTVYVDNVHELTIDDITDTSNSYIFSDGVGIISPKLAREVATKLRFKKDEKAPSAFQVRFGGAKGMLAVWDIFEDSEQEIQVALRPSMKKFDSQHRTLEVVGYSKRLPLFLNRQIITLLSGMGVPDASFMDLQKALLRKLDSAMQSDGAEDALDLLYSSGTCASESKLKASAPMMNTADFFRAGLTCDSSELLFNMMYAFRLRTIRNLMTRARIPLDSTKGVCLIGIMDEQGVLAADEIYCSFVEPLTKRVVNVTGNVTVGRSPCLHPGDIQPVKAQFYKSLSHLIDVIVFPQHGVRPIPSMLSGGDLDGDIYFCLFDRTISLPLGTGYQPMNYTAPVPPKLSRPVTTADVADFFVSYIRNDRLGQIANAHVVHADRQPQGIKSSECIKLAHLHSEAVDFAKTGVPAKFPKDLAIRFAENQHPDFMEKPKDVSYESKRILGKLFRACRSVSRRAQEYEFCENIRSRRVNSIIDSFPVDESLAVEADTACCAYNTELRRLMEIFGVKTEGEVVTGQVSSFSARHGQLRGRREYFALQMRLNRRAHDLRSEFREVFFSGLDRKAGFDGSGAAIIKACEWHRACRRIAKADTLAKTIPLLSFPWVVSDILLKVISNELGK